jgi:hypothetical protein
MLLAPFREPFRDRSTFFIKRRKKQNTDGIIIGQMTMLQPLELLPSIWRISTCCALIFVI